jgi:hypothetical protein
MEALRIPMEFSSDLGKCIQKKNFERLKSHNYHILMQQILPLALCELMCKVFRCLCTKVYNPANFQSLKADVAKSMALLEIEFPPSFFDILTHLPYHLEEELDMCGPVNAQWMYLVERYMKVLKNYMRNMARPKACMAEGYLKDECIGFIIEYLQRFEATQRCMWDEDEEYNDALKVLQGAGKAYIMTPKFCDMAHYYVLTNIFVMHDLYKYRSCNALA